jgi:hypothetical protein
MTDLRGDGMNPEEHDARSATEPTANEPPVGGRDTGVELDRMSRRLGERIRRVRKTRILKLICLLLALGSGALPAQVAVPQVRDSAGAAPKNPAPLRFDQTLVGTDRLGIFPTPVSDAAAASDPLAVFPAQSLRHRGPGVALMIVGAAAVVTGLLIEESLITILGAGTGLVGLYLYLR